METNALLSDFSDEAVDAGTGAMMRAAFGMSGTPKYRFQYPCPSRCLRGCDEGSMRHKGFEKYVRRTREPKTATAMRFCLDRADPIHYFSQFHSPAIIRRLCGEPVATP
jgi:hypothetical protein